MKLSKTQQALLSMALSEQGKKGGKAKFANMTSEEKELYMLKMRMAKKSKAAKALTPPETDV